ncbi:MAG: polysaccharide deacetylase family protein [Patescibacteria group bacterium]
MIKEIGDYIIVNYHYVEDTRLDWGGIHPCSVKEFERQVDFLSKNFEIVSMGQVFNSAKNGLSGKFCAITFDDGLKGQYENALPILLNNKVIGTFFPITSTFEGRLPATHKVHALLSHISSLELIDIFHKFIKEFYPDIESTYFIPKDKRLFERRKHEDLFTANFKETMISLPEDIKGRFLRYCFKMMKLDEKKISKEIFMNKDDVVNLCGQKMEIGSHSHGHYSMSAVGAEFLKKDIQLSKDILSNLLNKNIDTFSYSHGHYTDFGIKVLKDMGFKNAVTIEPRSVTKEDNAFLLPRYDANDIRDFISNIN